MSKDKAKYKDGSNRNRNNANTLFSPLSPLACGYTSSLFLSQGLSLLSCSWQNLYSRFYPDVNILELNAKSTAMG